MAKPFLPRISFQRSWLMGRSRVNDLGNRQALSHPDSAVVTGAFSYTGRYVARRLLDEGIAVRTLTRNPDREGLFSGLVEASPLDFSDPDGLR